MKGAEARRGVGGSSWATPRSSSALEACEHGVTREGDGREEEG